jgi:hypothetical protein
MHQVAMTSLLECLHVSCVAPRGLSAEQYKACGYSCIHKIVLIGVLPIN